MTKQTSDIQMIPLSKLAPSPRNVRRTDRKADIDCLAASIAACGLLQNLCVVAAGDKFQVDAGGRRLAALKKLARDKVIPRDHPVPCQVVELQAGREVSLMENVHRVAMDAIDEVEAYSALAADGLTRDEIAHRFGVTRRHVDQRLALSGLSPKIKAAWKRGEVTLDAARAFCLVDDHGQQEAVFRSLGRPVSHASSVRARLMDGRMRASDRLAVHVGLEAYEAAGGTLLRDLFDEDAVFIENPALLMRLAEDKLDAARADWAREGWSWVETQLGTGGMTGLAAIRLHPQWRDPTAEEQAELDRIRGELDRLDAGLDADGADDDPRWSERDDLEAAYETIRQSMRSWSPEARQVAGALLSIAHDGSVIATEGLVRSEDQKRAQTLLRKQQAGTDEAAESVDASKAEALRASRLPKAISRELTLVRTRAIRSGLANNPDTALALCVAAMLMRTEHIRELPGVAISVQTRNVEDLPAQEAPLAGLAQAIPADDTRLLDWTLDQPREHLLDLLARAVASSVDLSHEDAEPADLRKQAVADSLAQHLDLDMRRYWTADLDYWVRLPKAVLLTELAESPGLIERSASDREQAIRACGKLRKEDLAARVAEAFEGAGYLPDILVTPAGRGAFDLSDHAVTLASVPALAAE